MIKITHEDAQLYCVCTMYKHLENSCHEQFDGVAEDEGNHVAELNEETETPANEKTFVNPYREAVASRTNEN